MSRGARPTPRLRANQQNSRAIAAAALRRLQEPGAVERRAQATHQTEVQVRQNAERAAKALHRPDLAPLPPRRGRKGR